MHVVGPVTLTVGTLERCKKLSSQASFATLQCPAAQQTRNTSKVEASMFTRLGKQCFKPGPGTEVSFAGRRQGEDQKTSCAKQA